MRASTKLAAALGTVAALTATGSAVALVVPDKPVDHLQQALASDASDRYITAMQIDPATARQVGQSELGSVAYLKASTRTGLSCIVTTTGSGACAPPAEIAAGRGWGTEICPPDATTPAIRIRGQMPADVREVIVQHAQGEHEVVPVADGFFLQELPLAAAQADRPTELRWSDSKGVHALPVPLNPEFATVACYPVPVVGAD